MRKYWAVFKMGIERELEYRFNFFLGRLRNIIILLLLYFVWQKLTYKTGFFASYSSIELFTYVLGANILRSIIFGSQSRQVASEINNGWFSKYLVMPINHFWYEFSRQLAERSIHFLSSIIEALVFIFVFKVRLIWQLDFVILSFFVVSVVMSVFIYFILSYLMNLIAFWSREAMGPRFLFDWLIEFMSGAYFPLNILNQAFFYFLTFLPFLYTIYFPLNIYIGKIGYDDIFYGFAIQILWIIIIGLITRYSWQRGLKKFSGEGM